jgi:hypothetical protein
MTSPWTNLSPDTRNAHDNLLLHMQQKVVMGVQCNARVKL